MGLGEGRWLSVRRRFWFRFRGRGEEGKEGRRNREIVEIQWERISMVCRRKSFPLYRLADWPDCHETATAERLIAFTLLFSMTLLFSIFRSVLFSY